MKTKELIDILKQGVKPVVKFTEGIHEIESADPNMMGRVVGYKDIDIWERGSETVTFIIDFSEFVEYNKNFAERSWRDDNGSPTLTWFESKFYPKDHKEDIVEMLIENFKDSKLEMFEVVETSKHFEDFLAQKEETDYIKYLENLLDEKTN